MIGCIRILHKAEKREHAGTKRDKKRDLMEELLGQQNQSRSTDWTVCIPRKGLFFTFLEQVNLWQNIDSGS